MIDYTDSEESRGGSGSGRTEGNSDPPTDSGGTGGGVTSDPPPGGGGLGGGALGNLTELHGDVGQDPKSDPDYDPD